MFFDVKNTILWDIGIMVLKIMRLEELLDAFLFEELWELDVQNPNSLIWMQNFVLNGKEKSTTLTLHVFTNIH